jgi:hypothetical protein
MRFGRCTAPVGALVLDPGHFIMERKMMLQIKRLAERRVAGEQSLAALSS